MRFILRLAVTALLLMIFNYVGWMHISGRELIENNSFWNQFLIALIISFIFLIAMWIWAIISGVIGVLTLGIGFLLLIFIGPGALWLLSKMLPNLIAINANIWINILMGFLLAVSSSES